MAKARSNQPEETASQASEEAAVQAPQERAVQRPREERGAPPRNVRMTGVHDYSRARPRQKPVEVVRAWPGVTNGQLVVLHPAHQKRLLRGGFVKEV